MRLCASFLNFFMSARYLFTTMFIIVGLRRRRDGCQSDLIGAIKVVANDITLVVAVILLSSFNLRTYPMTFQNFYDDVDTHPVDPASPVEIPEKRIHEVSKVEL